MDELVYSRLLKNSQERKEEARQFANRRYLFEKAARTKGKTHVGIYGLRGVGKTVLLLQIANTVEKSFYFSADADYLKNEDLYEVLRFVSSRGYSQIFVDEIHCRKGWTGALKTAYDDGIARVFFSGSSAIELRGGADLSRRAILHYLRPLSFREYLVMKKGFGGLRAVAQSELFNGKAREAFATAHARFAAFLQEYYEFGGLAFPSSDQEEFRAMVANTLEKMLQSDLGYAQNLRQENVEEARKILQWIALSPPAELSYSSLSGKLGVSKPTVMKIVDALCRMGLVLRVLPCGKDLVRKEPKLYLSPPFRIHITRSVLREPDMGALREEFFVAHASPICYLKGTRGQKTPDFVFEGRSVEVGGAGKNFGQEPEFVFKDSEEFTGSTIPLYMAGFLY